MEQNTRYRIVAEHLFNHLEDLVEDVDPAIHQSALGRILIASTLIDKAAAVLLEDFASTDAYALVSRVVADCFSNEDGFKKSG